MLTEASSSDMLSHKKLTPKGVQSIPINDEKYLEMGEKSIPVDEKFFYRYVVCFLLSWVLSTCSVVNLLHCVQQVIDIYNQYLLFMVSDECMQ